MTSIKKEDSNRRMIQCLPQADIDDSEVFREVSSPTSNGVQRRRPGLNGGGGSPGDNYQLEDADLRRTGIEDSGGQEDSAENLGPLRAFPVGEVRVPSRNRNSSDVECVDDDGESSSVCSEHVVYSGGGDFLSLPWGDPSSKWSTWERNPKMRKRERGSLLELLEKQRRESVESRLKELRIPNQRHSVSSSLSNTEMPIIAKSQPTKNATLPKQLRRTSYQSVIASPFFANSGLSTTKSPLLLSLGQENMRERRGSLVIPSASQSPIPSGTESFPLRATGSLSGIEHFVASPRKAAFAKALRPLPSEVTSRREDETAEPTEMLNSSLGSKIRALISDQWPDGSLENGCSNNRLAQDDDGWNEGHDSVSNGTKQIDDDDPTRPDPADNNSGDATETEEEEISSSMTDSPVASKKVYSAPDQALHLQLSVGDIRSSSAVEMMAAAKPAEQFKVISSPDNQLLPSDKLLNGTKPMKKELGSDKFFTDNNRHYETKNSVSLHLQKPAFSIETCREDNARRGSPAFYHQTSRPTTPQEAFLLGDHQTERETKANDLDSTRPRNLTHCFKENQVSVNPEVSAKYCSDIQIQIKEVEPVYPTNFGHARDNAAYINGGSRFDSRKDGAQTPIDDYLESVTPNWSSYPGPLPDGFQSTNLDNLNTTLKPVKKLNIVSNTPDRNISTLEINFQPCSADEREKVSKKIMSQTDKYDSPYDTNKGKHSDVLLSRADDNVDFQPQLDFNDRRKRIVVENVSSREVNVPGTSLRSVERNEMFVKEDTSSPACTPRTITLPREQRSRSWNRLDDQTRPLTSPRQDLCYSPIADASCVGNSPTTPDGLSVDVTPSSSKANVTRIMFYSKKDEQRTRLGDGGWERTRSSYEARGGVSTPSDRWQGSVVKREDRWRDSRTSVESRSPEKDRWNDSRTSADSSCRSQEKDRWNDSSTSVESSYRSQEKDRWNDSRTSVESSYRSPEKDRWNDSRTSSDSSCRSPEKTPSVERMWETLEQPRTRLTRRNLRLESGESDSEVGSSKGEKPQYPQRSSLVINGEEAMVRSISLQNPAAEGGASAEEPCVLEIEVLKGGLGLGFCIEGGKDGPYGDRPITVKRLFRGSSDPKFSSGVQDTLRAGDEILTANGRDMTLLSRFVAWNFLKTLPEGTIRLVVRRRTSSDSKQPQ